jgi:hypothetical protein
MVERNIEKAMEISSKKGKALLPPLGEKKGNVATKKITSTNNLLGEKGNVAAKKIACTNNQCLITLSLRQ